MAPISGVKVAGKVARKVIKMVAQSAIQKSRGREVNVAGAVGVVVLHGLRKVQEAGGVRPLLKRGVAKVQREGLRKTALDLVKRASGGTISENTVLMVKFKGDGTCSIFMGDSPDRNRNSVARPSISNFATPAGDRNMSVESDKRSIAQEPADNTQRRPHRWMKTEVKKEPK